MTESTTTATSAAARSIRLSDGHEMPQVGYGLWQVDPETTAGLVETALAAGYRSVDTATIYENEAGVGEGLRRAEVAREDVFVTTKLWNHRHEDVRGALDGSLELLGLDRVDLYLIHWPSPAKGNFRAAWRGLVQAQAEGLATSIGVSNFAIEHLEAIIEDTGVTPAVNQVELHPLFQQAELRAFHAAHDIATEAWSPLGQGGPLLADPTIAAIAEAHGRTPAQVVLRWHLQVGNVVIPKSVTPSRITANLQLEGFELAAEEMSRIEALDSVDGRIGPDPSTATF